MSLQTDLESQRREYRLEYWDPPVWSTLQCETQEKCVVLGLSPQSTLIKKDQSNFLGLDLNTKKHFIWGLEMGM